MGRWQVHRREGEKKEVDQGLWGDGKCMEEKEEVDQGLWEEGKCIGEKERRRKWTKACGKKAST